MSTIFNYKIVQANNFVQIKKYSEDMFKNFTNKRKKESYEKTTVDSDNSEDVKKREDSIQRTRENLIQTIHANATQYTKFITLTCKESILDRDAFLYQLRQFRKYFKRHFGYQIKYVGVLERQKERGMKENNEGSFHAHLVVFNNDKLDFETLKKCWPCGSVDIKKINDNIHGVAKYLSKYITKDITDIGISKQSILKTKNLSTAYTMHLYNPSEQELQALTYNSTLTYNKLFSATNSLGQPISIDLSEYILN